MLHLKSTQRFLLNFTSKFTCKIAKIAWTALIMLWDKPWQFRYRILLCSVQSKWWVKSKSKWYSKRQWCLQTVDTGWNWYKERLRHCKQAGKFSLRKKNHGVYHRGLLPCTCDCTRTHSQLPSYPVAQFSTPGLAGSSEDTGLSLSATP